MPYRRPHPVKDPRLAAARLLEARTTLIGLVLGPGVDGAIAVRISNAIETLEAAAENYGAIRDLEPPAPFVPVTPEELAAVHAAIDERAADVEQELGRRVTFRGKQAECRSHTPGISHSPCWTFG